MGATPLPCCASGDKHPPIVDLANFEERKDEITQQLMKAATKSGMALSHVPAHSSLMPRRCHRSEQG